MFRHRIKSVKLALTLLVISSFIATGPLTVTTAQGNAFQRLIVRTKSAADYAALREAIEQSGGQLILDRPDLNLMVVSIQNSYRAQIDRSPYVAGVATDQVEDLLGPETRALIGKSGAGTPQRVRINLTGTAEPTSAPTAVTAMTPDPAFTLPGLMWNMIRIRANSAWQQPVGLGEPYVRVGVIDTGLDYTHIELQNKVVQSIDFTLAEDPNICSTNYGLPTDAQLKTAFGAPGADLDFNGHGTWIGGNIAARLNVTGTNGIAPRIGLVSLKVAQNCGVAYDSTIISAILYAADNGIDVVNLSFSHYLNRSNAEDDTLYQAYTQAVAYARAKGTAIVAGAGDEHARIGAGGQVIGHGTLSSPPGGVDNYGLWQVPGGIPGVVDVSATVNVVNASSASCPADSLAAGSHQWCKPASDAHQPQGAGLQNQLAVYSNYGPRVDLAAPGGSRKFNLPAIDRGGAEGWPWTGINSVEGGTSVSDGYNAWEDYGITSDFATEIPCFTFTSDPVFPNNQCYAIIQGTSLAASHVAAVLAVTASKLPGLWHQPDLLVAYVKTHTLPLSGNATTQASATDTSNGDTGGTCPNAYCHLGSTVIPDTEAYGAGLVDAFGPFWTNVFLPTILR